MQERAQAKKLESVHPEIVASDSDQGRSDVETAGVACLLRRRFQRSENAELGCKMPFMDGHDRVKI